MVTDNEYHLLTFDPGAAATGWAWFCVDYRAFSRPEHKVTQWIKWWDSGEIRGPEMTMFGEAVALIVMCRDQYAAFLSMEVVSEDFELTQMVGSKENLLSPVRINSVLGWECHKRAIRFSLQSRSLRTNVTRGRLTAFGFEGKFRKDEFAAMQHGIVKLRRMKQEANKRPWKLMQGGQHNAQWDCSCAEGHECDIWHPK